jgi:hypothetical protein
VAFVSTNLMHGGLGIPLDYGHMFITHVNALQRAAWFVTGS